MTPMPVAEFCAKHGACPEGREWALANCQTMAEVWRDARPEWLIWVATRNGVLTDRELRLFAVWAARRVQHLMTDARSVAALDVAERFANGHATEKELAAACAAAWDAARDAAWAAAWDAACAAARAAAWDASGHAARDAACAAVRAASGHAARAAACAAAWDAARDAARAAACAAARAAQAQWLRDKTTPCFNAAAPENGGTTNEEK